MIKSLRADDETAGPLQGFVPTMSAVNVQSVVPARDEDYQDHVLPHVSRTFALTIPQLPPALRTPVTSAYLLCRIADTIEDEPALSPDATLALLQRFVAVVSGREDAELLAQDLAPQLSGQTLPAERDLVLNMGRVIRVLNRFEVEQRVAIERCVEVMCGGMHQFQQTASLKGLPRATDLDDYCYYVAGVVGQMLTELFCFYSPEIHPVRGALHELDVSFAQGLQMTNILKDVWEDRARGACWLPQEVFARHGIDLAELRPGVDQRFVAAMSELVAIAHGHLRNALRFTLLIPSGETGIRRFCLWAIGLAVLTLRKIEATPGFTAGAQVKVSHLSVALTRALTSSATRSNWLLKQLFAMTATGLPVSSVTVARRPLKPVLHVAESSADYGHGSRAVPIERATRSEGRSAH